MQRNSNDTHGFLGHPAKQKVNWEEMRNVLNFIHLETQSMSKVKGYILKKTTILQAVEY